MAQYPPRQGLLYGGASRIRAESAAGISVNLPLENTSCATARTIEECFLIPTVFLIVSNHVGSIPFASQLTVEKNRLGKALDIFIEEIQRGRWTVCR